MWLLVTVTAICLAIGLLGLRFRRNKHLPPGPKPIFILGNLLDVPGDGSAPWKVYAKWGKTYGLCTSLKLNS